jgi:hypothetical protein
MQKRINDHQRITMLLATEDVRSLRRIISVALRNGASISALLNQMQRAIDGKYSPRGSFSEREYAIGFLAKALGGPRLLYALSKGDKYPSVSSVAQKYRIPRIIPSVSEPSRQEISNITMFFGASGKQAPAMMPNLLLRSVLTPILTTTRRSLSLSHHHARRRQAKICCGG